MSRDRQHWSDRGVRWTTREFRLEGRPAETGCRGQSVPQGAEQGDRVHASGEQEIQQETVDWKDFKTMSFVCNSTFRRCQRSGMDLEDLGHFGDATATAAIVLLKRICFTVVVLFLYKTQAKPVRSVEKRNEVELLN